MPTYETLFITTPILESTNNLADQEFGSWRPIAGLPRGRVGSRAVAGEKLPVL